MFALRAILCETEEWLARERIDLDAHQTLLTVKLLEATRDVTDGVERRRTARGLHELQNPPGVERPR